MLLAAMAGFHATLTLPGIAGIALTIGMAVDTNILIFERIREELRRGQDGARGHRRRLLARLQDDHRHPRDRARVAASSSSSSAPGPSRASR